MDLLHKIISKPEIIAEAFEKAALFGGLPATLGSDFLLTFERFNFSDLGSPEPAVAFFFRSGVTIKNQDYLSFHGSLLTHAWFHRRTMMAK